MAAPEAPRIRAFNVLGGVLRVAWKPVEDATDYNIYLGETPDPEGLEDSVEDSEEEVDGSFVWHSTPYPGHLYVRVTALNVLAEESDYSNQKHRNAPAFGTNVVPTQALDRVRKGPR